MADAVYEHYKHFDNKSLGVGAFSQRQQKEIKDRIEAIMYQNYDFDQWCKTGPSNKVNEGLFIKNLETIQGDERDVIFLSMGYGKDKNGKLHMGFGPLNQKGGERRLNVLVTRAREKVQFFTSVKSSDLDLSRTSSHGAKLLHQYLKFAESDGDVSTLDNPFELSADVDQDNIFQQGVYAEIVEAGYDAIQEVGQAGYKIDIGIIDPNNKSKFLLAVECDGATYHSSATTRDRDRLRQSVLENLGWRFHRIWSTDWFQNPHSEMKKLESAIHGLKKEKISSVTVNTTEFIDHSDPKPRKSDIIVIPYENTPISVLGDLDDLYQILKYAPDNINALIKNIIEIESPVHLSTIGNRVRAAYGIGQIGKYIRSEIKNNADRLINQSNGQYFKDIDYSIGKSIYYLEIPIRTVIRNRENAQSVRDFNHIHFSEILSAFYLIIDNENSIQDDAIISKVRELFGFKTGGSKIKNRIKVCLKRAFEENKLAISNGNISKGSNYKSN